MDSALGFGFAAPAPRPGIFFRGNSSGAGQATDGFEAVSFE